MKWLLLTVIMGCSLGSGFAQTSDLLNSLPEDVAKLKLECEISRAELRKPLIGLRQQYVKRLIQLRDAAQSRGVLNELLAVTNEIKRAKGQPLERDELPESEHPADLIGARNIYERGREALMVRARRDEEPLVKEYHSALLARVNELTRAERLEGAVLVKQLLEIELKKYQSERESPTGGDGLRPIGAFANKSTPGRLEIRAQLDGRSHLYIRGKQIWYDHSEGKSAPVGRHGSDHPSEVNGEEWLPVWEGKRTRPLDIAETLSKSEPPPKIRATVLDGRGTVEVVEQPSAANKYTAKIEMRDQNKDGRGFYGSDWLEFRLTW